MQLKRISESSHRTFPKYFWSALKCNLSIRMLITFLLSGRYTQVWPYAVFQSFHCLLQNLPRVSSRPPSQWSSTTRARWWTPSTTTASSFSCWPISSPGLSTCQSAPYTSPHQLPWRSLQHTCSHSPLFSHIYTIKESHWRSGDW